MTNPLTRQISQGQVPRTLRAGHVWDRNDENIIFAKDNDGDEMHDIYSIHIESGEVRREGEDFEYVEYDDIGHGSGDIEQKIRWFHAFIGFLGRNL